jgi:hypothetical protein
VKLFKEPKSKFYWFDFTVRGYRYRGSTITMKQAHSMCILHSLIRAMRTGSIVNAWVVENTIPPNTPDSITRPCRVVTFDRFMAPLRHRKATKEDSTVSAVLPSSTGEHLLEVESDLSRKRPRRYVVRATEGGEEVVQRLLVRHIDGREAQTPPVVVAAEEVVVPHTDVK